MKEYKVVQYHWNEDDGWCIPIGPYSDESNFDISQLLEKFLNLYAQDGWRLVSFTPMQGGVETDTEASYDEFAEETSYHSVGRIDERGVIILERDV